MHSVTFDENGNNGTVESDRWKNILHLGDVTFHRMYFVCISLGLST